MLVICNGAIKGGSTGQYNILIHLVELGRPRGAYRYQGRRFLRMGVVGDWRIHFDRAMIRNIERIEANGIGPLDWHSLRRPVSTQLAARRR